MPTPKKSDDFKLCGMCWKDDKVTFQHVSNTYLCNRCGYKWSAEKPLPQKRPGLKFGYRGPKIWRKRQAGTVPLITVVEPPKPAKPAVNQELFGKSVLDNYSIKDAELTMEMIRGAWPKSDFMILDETGEAFKKKPPGPPEIETLKGDFMKFMEKALVQDKDNSKFKEQLKKTFEEAEKAKIKAKCNHNKIKCNWILVERQLAAKILCDTCGEDISKEKDLKVQQTTVGRSIVGMATLNDGLWFKYEVVQPWM